MFALIIFIRVLFVASMIFIIGSVFGSFSAKPALRVISKIAAILVIVLFIAMNIMFVRAAMNGRWHGENGKRAFNHQQYECRFQPQDSTRNQNQ